CTREGVTRAMDYW
nr:immunoglobulin heavy chain junction region [Mus musculus]